ncbi:MAG: antitoxin [Acidobacteria bacterium]|nr:antitoxin [Acidobacteriota bacterium]MCI0620091.1 antitoxin [Acidobacteriota bacterium]
MKLDDDVFELAARLAKCRGVSLGRAVSDLIRKGLKAQFQVRQKGGLAVFDLPADSPAVTMETVKRLETESG